MKKNIFRLLAIMLVITGCKKEVNQLGFGVQPESDKINVSFSDTTTVGAYSTPVDSITSSNAPLSLAGSMHDPVFGTTTASFSTTFRLSKTSFSFGDNPQVDSLILSLDYESLTGDTNSQVTLRFYELTEDMLSDTVYYSNSQIDYSDVLISEITFLPNTRDSVVVGADTLDPHLRVNLESHSDVLAQKLVNATDEEMGSNSAFQELFKGLRVEAAPATSGGQIIAFDLLSNLSAITLYYRNDESDSLTYTYGITGNSVRVGHFAHDYSTGDSRFRQQVQDGDTTLGAELNYVQPLSGVSTQIFFPHIEEWYSKSPVVVNEARIFLYGYEEFPYIDPPANLLLVRVSEDGTLVPLLEQLEGIDYFGGSYDEENNRYWFRITSYIQELMRGTLQDHGLSVVVNGAAYNTGRFIFVGPEPGDLVGPEKKMRIEIKYTALDNSTSP